MRSSPEEKFPVRPIHLWYVILSTGLAIWVELLCVAVGVRIADPGGLTVVPNDLSWYWRLPIKWLEQPESVLEWLARPAWVSPWLLAISVAMLIGVAILIGLGPLPLRLAIHAGEVSAVIVGSTLYATTSRQRIRRIRRAWTIRRFAGLARSAVIALLVGAGLVGLHALLLGLAVGFDVPEVRRRILLIPLALVAAVDLMVRRYRSLVEEATDNATTREALDSLDALNDLER